jgi:stress response protein SCP2
MTQLAKGQRLSLRDIVPTGALQVGLAAQGLPLDFACFGLDSVGKLFNDGYMTFFNQPRTPCGAVQASGVAGDTDGFAFQLHKLPALVERVVIVVSAGGAGVMSHISAGHLKLLESQGRREFALFEFTGSDFSAEQALMLSEFYRKDGGWRFMAVGQGFNGGLDALVRHFGGTVNETPAYQASAQPALPAKISFEKRVEREAPRLVNLVKQAGVSLEKVGLVQ